MARALIGEKLVDRDGNTVGKITDVIVDSATLENEWITVKTGMMGGEHLVPIPTELSGPGPDPDDVGREHGREGLEVAVLDDVADGHASHLSSSL